MSKFHLALTYLFVCAWIGIFLAGSAKMEPLLVTPVADASFPSPTPNGSTSLPQNLGRTRNLGEPQEASHRTEIESYIEQVFGKHAETAKRIAFCESSFNPHAKHKVSSATGLYQFIDKTWVWVRGKMGRDTSLSLKTDWKESVDTAYKLFEIYGFNSTASWHASAGCWKGKV